MHYQTKFKFERLHIWQDAMELGEKITNHADSFPRKELYNLSSQICRAIDSVALNISEGSIIQSIPEFRRFLGYAVRSLAEVVTCLHKAKNRNYISTDIFDGLYLDCYKLMNMIIAFRTKL
ncbi:four helix bundle protein [Flagellimonas allohymeniacidonis]|uniref:Four helix bundle protein n=1 Tax=Flagellimonas allohymeniacidonis TaxID=2517819 RepID=A0A4Q8QKD4_9FLAO|nr:four helix bundle protein [Allomuricauda hymeniacidonis]TAI49243.1 four helix bundle protein [Allomuricauda hymeniacidonis]